MITLAIANHKGGVGKTTLAANLAAGIAARGRRVLAVDLDAGAGLTTTFDAGGRGLAAFLLGRDSPEVYAATVRPRLDVIGSRKADTAGLEYDARVLGDKARTLLKRRLAGAAYDFAVLDFGPGINVLYVNGIMAADFVITPVLCDYLSLAALRELQADLAALGGARIAAVIPMMTVDRRKVTGQVIDIIKRDFGLTVAPSIRAGVRWVESPSFHKTITEYDPRGRGAADIAAVTAFILKLTGKDKR